MALALLGGLPAGLLAQGRPVTLVAENQDVRQVLMTLAAAAGVRLNIDPEMRGLITIRIENRPFEEALTTIATLYNLEWRKERDTYWIGARREVERPREVVVHLQHANAEEVARAFGYVDLKTLEHPMPAPLPRLLPAGMETPAPGEGNSLVLRGTSTAIRGMQELLLRMDLPAPLLSLEAALVRLPLSQASGLRLRWQERPAEVYRADRGARALPFVVREGGDWLPRLLTAPGVEVIARPRLFTAERRPALLRMGRSWERDPDSPIWFRWPSRLSDPGYMMGWVSVVREAGRLQTWLKFAFTPAPDEGGGSRTPPDTWTVVVDGYLVPPEETMILWLSPDIQPPSPAAAAAPSRPSQREPRLYLLLLKPGLMEAGQAPLP